MPEICNRWECVPHGAPVNDDEWGLADAICEVLEGRPDLLDHWARIVGRDDEQTAAM